MEVFNISDPLEYIADPDDLAEDRIYTVEGFGMDVMDSIEIYYKSEDSNQTIFLQVSLSNPFQSDDKYSGRKLDGHEYTIYYSNYGIYGIVLKARDNEDPYYLNFIFDSFLASDEEAEHFIRLWLSGQKNHYDTPS